MQELITTIKHFIEKEASQKYGLVIIKKASLENGIAYELQKGSYSFGCILQQFSALKITFYLYDCFREEEETYWSTRYKFKLFTESDTKEYKTALTLLEIKNFLKDPLKIIMYRYTDTIGQFTRDLKALSVMAQTREATS